MKSSIQSILRYGHFIRWLVTDALWRNKGLAFLVLVTGFLGVVFQIQVFALIIYYARHLSSGELIRLLGYEFDPRTSLDMLAVVSVGVVVSLLLAGVAIYYSRRAILSLGRKYEEFCAKRVFNVIGSVCDVFSSAGVGLSEDRYLLMLVNTDSRACNRVLRMLLSLIIPVLTFSVAIAALFYLEPFLTFVVLALLGAFSFLQSRVSQKAAARSIRFEKSKPTATKEYKVLIEHFRQQAQHMPGHDVVNRLFTTGPVRKKMDAYEGWLRIVESSRLLSAIFMALVLGLILIFMGGAMIREGSGWGRLLVYAIALRFALTDLQNSFAIMTNINRFYPQLYRYFLFVQGPRHEGKKEYLPLDEYELRVGKDSLKGSQGNWVLRRGARLALITSLDLNRYTMAAVTRSFLGESEQILKTALFSMRFVTAIHSSPETSLRQAMGLHAQSECLNLKNWFANDELWEMTRQQLPNDLDEIIKLAAWDAMEPRLNFALSLISSANSDCRWVLIDAKALSLLDQESVRFYLDLLKDKITVLVFNENVSRVGVHGEDGVAVAGEGAPIGLGSVEWFAGVRDQVEQKLGIGRRKKRRKDEIDDEEDLDEET